MLVFPFLTLEQHNTFKESMINRLSNLVNRNRSAAKISQVLLLCSSAYISNVMYIYGFQCAFMQKSNKKIKKLKSLILVCNLVLTSRQFMP